MGSETEEVFAELCFKALWKRPLAPPYPFVKKYNPCSEFFSTRLTCKKD